MNRARKNFKGLLLIIFLIGISLSSAFAADFVMGSAKSVGLSKKESALFVEIFKLAFNQEAKGKHQLLENASEADFLIHPKFIKLGSQYILSVDKIRKGKVIYAVKIKAKKKSEVDIKMGQLLRSLFDEEAPQAKVGEVTKADQTRQSYRHKSINRSRFSFGPGLVGNLNSKDIMLNIGLGVNFEMGPQSAMRAIYDGFFATEEKREDYFHLMGLGLQYHFNTDKHGPYAACDLGYGWAGRDIKVSGEKEDEVNGFGLGFEGGMTFFRTGQRNFQVSLRYQVLMKKNTEGLPYTLGLRVGLLF